MHSYFSSVNYDQSLFYLVHCTSRQKKECRKKWPCDILHGRVLSRLIYAQQAKQKRDYSESSLIQKPEIHVLA